MNIFEEAEKAVGGDRMNHYGHPADNHRRTAKLWRDYLEEKHGVVIELDSVDVCWLNVLQKIARDIHTPKRDNLVDTAGYVRNIEMIRAHDADERDRWIT